MSTHNSKYWVDGEIYHFETEGKSVVIYDDNKNVIGTFNDLAFKGKVVENVDYRTIKTTGVYNVKGLKNIPSNIPSDKRAILSVTAIGGTDNPDVIFYKIIGSNGVIAENTVSGSNSSGWGNGGVTLENTINTIKTDLNGTKGDLTKVKSNLSDVGQLLVDLKSKFNSHNHDGRYISRGGDTIQGNFAVKAGSGYRFVRQNGQYVNMASVGSDDNFYLGDGNLHVMVNSKNGLEVNGHKVYTTENAGEGSGIDADKLDGINSESFVRKDKYNVINTTLDIRNKSSVLVTVDDGYDSGLFFRRNDDFRVAGLLAKPNGEMSFQNYGGESGKFMSDGILKLNVGQYLVAEENQKAYIEFRQHSWTSGIGFQMDTNKESLHVVNWKHDSKNIMDFGYGKNGEAVYINESPYIRGRRLFLQDDTPSGDIPNGSIWIS